MNEKDALTNYLCVNLAAGHYDTDDPKYHRFCVTLRDKFTCAKVDVYPDDGQVRVENFALVTVGKTRMARIIDALRTQKESANGKSGV